MLRIRAKMAWYKFYLNNPYVTKMLQGFWNNKFLILAIVTFIEYMRNLRYKYFIDKENRTLYTLTKLRDIDAKIRKATVDFLKNYFMSEKEQEVLAKYLFRLVTTDKYSQDVITDLFVLMLRGPAFTRDTQNLTEWALGSYLQGDMAVR